MRPVGPVPRKRPETEKTGERDFQIPASRKPAEEDLLLLSGHKGAVVRDRRLYFFLPRARTPCRHGAQVIVEGRKYSSDGGEENPYPLWLKASRLKLAAKAVELGGSRLLLKEKKFSRVVTRS